jgi:MoaA/NifB/PqqE/SkfB family radical SAM enzyme
MDAHAARRSGPRRITFVTNPDDCNLACRMCREHSPLASRRAPPASWRLPHRVSRHMSTELVEQILREREGSALAEVIPSTKGEPLLWTGLDHLAEWCAAHDLLLNVTTNGTFPGRGATAWAELLVPVACDVKISWNAATAATAAEIMGGLCLDRALEDVRAFVRVRDARRAAGARACRVSFQVTAQEANVVELAALVRLAAELGVERIKVNQLQIHHRQLAGQDLRRDTASRARWNEAVRGMRAAVGEHRLPSGDPVLLQNVEAWPEAFGEPARGPCPFLDREAWVTAEGRFAPCPAPAGQDGLLGDFGSLHDRPFGEIWESAGYRALVDGYERHAECRRCPMRRAGGV